MNFRDLQGFSRFFQGFSRILEDFRVFQGFSRIFKDLTLLPSSDPVKSTGLPSGSSVAILRFSAFGMVNF